MSHSGFMGYRLLLKADIKMHTHTFRLHCGVWDMIALFFFPQKIVLLQLLQVTSDSMIVSGRSVICRRGHQHHPLLISTPAAPAIKRTNLKLLLSCLRLTDGCLSPKTCAKEHVSQPLRVHSLFCCRMDEYGIIKSFMKYLSIFHAY